MILLQKQDIKLDQVINNFHKKNKNIGAVVTFLGLVRDFNNGEIVKEMSLEHYPQMTLKELSKVGEMAREKWDLIDYRIIHRYGPLKPGEKIVFILTASEHRQNAFEACEFIIDWLKVKAPFWKCEKSDQTSHWVEQKSKDLQKADEWLKKIS